MKKLSQFLVAMFLCIASVFTLSACGDDVKITSATVKAGTLITTIVKNDDLITSKVVLVVKYSDGKQVEVPASNLTFGAFDTSSEGVKDLEITYSDYTIKVPIKIVASEADVSSILRLESELIRDYNANKAVSSTSSEGFFDQTQPLYVGNDNAFNFRIKASGVDAQDNLVTNLAKVRTIIKVEEKQANGSFVELTGDALTNVVAIDTENTTFNFAESAIGKTYKITVEAANKDALAEPNATKFSSEVTVINGFNVYNAKDLSVFDNYNTGWQTIQDEVKAEHGLTSLDSIGGIVLQDDINITKADVRTDAFWKTTDADYGTKKTWTDQPLEGSLIDSSVAGIYFRQIKNGETFDFVGNYFAVNASAMPKSVVGYDGDGVNVANSEMKTSHTCLFFTKPFEGQHISDANTKVNYKNISFIGNGEMSNDVRNSGALLMMKNNEINFEAYNTVTTNFYITYFFEQGSPENDAEGNYLVKKCKGYNSYQNLFYVWGGENTTILESEFKNCGGPVILADVITADNDDPYYKGAYAPVINIVASTLESVVSGQEPWFAEYDAGSYVGQIAMFDMFINGEVDHKYINGNPSTIIKDKIKDTTTENMIPRLNIVAVVKDGYNLESKEVEGAVYTFNTVEDYEKHYGLNGKTQEKTTYGMDLINGTYGNLSVSNGVPFFEFANSGYFVNTPYLAGTGVLSDYIRSTIYEAEAVLNGVYGGIYQNVGPLLQQAPTVEQFAAMNNTSQLAVIQTVLAGVSQAVDEQTFVQLLDGIYAGISANCPVNNWAELTTAAQKATAIYSQLEALVNRANSDFTNPEVRGNYLNIYMPLGLGVVVGVYPVAAA